MPGSTLAAVGGGGHGMVHTRDRFGSDLGPKCPHRRWSHFAGHSRIPSSTGGYFSIESLRDYLWSEAELLVTQSAWVVLESASTIATNYNGPRAAAMALQIYRRR